MAKLQTIPTEYALWNSLLDSHGKPPHGSDVSAGKWSLPRAEGPALPVATWIVENCWAAKIGHAEPIYHLDDHWLKFVANTWPRLEAITQEAYDRAVETSSQALPIKDAEFPPISSPLPSLNQLSIVQLAGLGQALSTVVEVMLGLQNQPKFELKCFERHVIPSPAGRFLDGLRCQIEDQHLLVMNELSNRVPTSTNADIRSYALLGRAIDEGDSIANIAMLAARLSAEDSARA